MTTGDYAIEVLKPSGRRESLWCVRIREAVDDNFLIVVNTGQSEARLSAPYVNGAFIETILNEGNTAYTHDRLREIESTLLWSEQNFRRTANKCA